MKKTLLLSLVILTLIPFQLIGELSSRREQNTLEMETGEILLTYSSFEEFLKSEDRSWGRYEELLFEPYPEVKLVHQRRLNWGIFTQESFEEQLKQYRLEDFASSLEKYTPEDIRRLYDATILRSHQILPPFENKPVNLCLFLPYGGCFVVPTDQDFTIYLSLRISRDDVPKILAHEYAHCFHMQRRPEEPLTLRREIVSEGLAVYLTTQVNPELGIENAIPFMPASSVAWCRENEARIISVMRKDLERSDEGLFYTYISDGKIATPPDGFVEKTAYYMGFRVIESCIEKGISLETLCGMDSRSIVDYSGYFNLNPTDE